MHIRRCRSSPGGYIGWYPVTHRRQAFQVHGNRQGIFIVDIGITGPGHDGQCAGAVIINTRLDHRRDLLQSPVTDAGIRVGGQIGWIDNAGIAGLEGVGIGNACIRTCQQL